MQTLLAIYLIAINAVAFLAYGLDKFKAKKRKWRISEGTLMLLAILGGGVGAYLGIKVWHHKTMHKKFRYGVPIIIIFQIAIVLFLLYEMKII